MGTLALAGAVGIVLVGTLWYRVYGRERTEREGAALDAIRRTTTDYALDRTRELLATGGERRVLIPVGSATTAERERDLLRLAADMLPQRTPTPDGGDARERTDGSSRFGADTDVDTNMGIRVRGRWGPRRPFGHRHGPYGPCGPFEPHEPGGRRP